jgi:hypothetical protein
MIDKITNNQIQDFFEKPKNNRENAAANNTADVKFSMQFDCANLVQKAAQASQDADVAVQQAKQLLNAGTLDTDQNIRKTAEIILENGI